MHWGRGPVTDILDVSMRQLPDYIQMQGGFSDFKVHLIFHSPYRMAIQSFLVSYQDGRNPNK